MTREEAKKLLPIIQAFAEDKTIQVKGPDNRWYDYKKKTCKLNFNSDPKDYRIKPEPKYRPFNNSEECWEEMQKHQPFGWVKNEQMKFNIVCIRPNGTVRTVMNNGIYNSWYSFKDSFQLKFIDGTPFGIKE